MHSVRMRLLSLLQLPPSSSTAQVRARYLEMVKDSHPDRCKDSMATARFCELQSLWEQYRSENVYFAASVDFEDRGGFTDFGVGCSWTDNNDEKARRNEVMEQASRGIMNPNQIT